MTEEEIAKAINTAFIEIGYKTPNDFERLRSEFYAEVNSITTKLLDQEPFFDAWLTAIDANLSNLNEFEELFREDLSLTFNASRVTLDRDNRIVNLDCYGDLFYLYMENEKLKIAEKK